MSSIQTSKGVLQGSGEGGLTVFRGIPYAQAPVRDLRFRAPRPVELWDATRDATDFGHVAPQITNPALDAVMEDEEQTQDEDCLYLNVWTPQLDGAQLPVMVWIHGGAFTIGSGSSPLYDGQHLARRGVVVVTINYRLGALGFLRVPGADGDVEANWGMLDQAAALEWVRDEIASFGGDPGNVTIFGESAGGMSVGSLMASPLARGLFRRAILESGAGHNALTVEEADATAAGFAKELGVASLEPARLRSLPWQQLVEAQAASEAAMTAEVAEGRPAAMRYQPVIDGHFLSQMPIEAMRGGSARDVSTLIGTTGEELKLFSALAPPGTPEPGEEQLARSAAWLISPEGDLERGRALLEQYRQARSARGESTDLKELVMAATTDQFFRVPADRLAEAQAALNPQTYAYRFDHPSPVMGGVLGTWEALELQFDFGTQAVAKAFAGEGPEVDALARRVGDAWTAFARTGAPATESLPAWSAFDSERRATMLLGTECGVAELPREQERRCWDGVVE